MSRVVKKRLNAFNKGVSLMDTVLAVLICCISGHDFRNLEKM